MHRDGRLRPCVEWILIPLAAEVLIETPEQIFARVFRTLRPRTPPPQIHLSFRKFANANSSVRWNGTSMIVKITDVLEGAPSHVLEALAYILMGKLTRKPVPRTYADRYRRYLNRKDVRRSLQLIRQDRGRKFVSGPQGSVFNLEHIFEDLNVRYFFGLMARPQLGWSRQPSRTLLGHYDPSHNAIILSRILDRPMVPLLAVEYVMFHEMLHLRFPVEHRGVRRCVHTREFKEAEKEFENLEAAKSVLKQL